MNCRFCAHILEHEFIDLVNSPPSNSFLTEEQLTEPEIFFPLKVYVCEKCWLVQIDEHKSARDIFGRDYVYYSSYSRTWLEHCKSYAEDMIARFDIDASWQVIEVASNDGYLLQYFSERGISVLGIEPAEGVARVAQEKGIATRVAYFGQELAESLVSSRSCADLLIGNNVLAHVPDINDFVGGMRRVLAAHGIITMEFPHLMQLIEHNQFDTIYHEHYSYLSLHSVQTIFAAHGLEIFDVQELSTHGGSLRIFARHQADRTKDVRSAVPMLLEREKAIGLTDLGYYLEFHARADVVKNELLGFLIEEKKQGRKVVGYGAAAKGNTLLNYCGIKPDLLPFVADTSPHKKGKYLPGSHIPVVSEEEIRSVQPENVLILPWNIKEEIMTQLAYVRDWGGKFVTPVPHLEIV